MYVIGGTNKINWLIRAYTVTTSTKLKGSFFLQKEMQNNVIIIMIIIIIINNNNYFRHVKPRPLN